MFSQQCTIQDNNNGDERYITPNIIQYIIMLARAGLFGVTQACYSVDDCCSVIIRATAWPSTARISASTTCLCNREFLCCL